MLDSTWRFCLASASIFISRSCSHVVTDLVATVKAEQADATYNISALLPSIQLGLEGPQLPQCSQ